MKSPGDDVNGMTELSEREPSASHKLFVEITYHCQNKNMFLLQALPDRIESLLDPHTIVSNAINVALNGT